MNFDIKEFVSSSMILFAIIDVIGNLPLVILLREKFKVIESGKATIISLNFHLDKFKKFIKNNHH